MTSVEMAPPVLDTIQNADPSRGLGIMNWLRNTRPGQLLANVSMSAAVILPGGTAMGMALVEAPSAMAAEKELTQASGQSQDCINAILAGPGIRKPPVMRHAGIRPTDPNHYKIQSITGIFEYPSLSEICYPELNIVRISRGQVQMTMRDNRKVYVKKGRNDNPIFIGNNEGIARISYGPGHNARENEINMCDENGNFQDVRIVMTNYAKDRKIHKFIAKQRKIIQVPVEGNCEEARHSKQVSESFG